MHSVQRSPEPAFLNDLRSRLSEWEQLENVERRQVRASLAEDFSRICGYCEQSCVEPTRSERDNEESVDHFRPRRYFSGDWLNWLNLIFACRRCNQSKDSKWPSIDGADNRRLARIARYEHISEYVCPNQSDTQPLCETLFAFNLDTGEIAPVDDLDDANWSRAYRTIVDIDLNSVYPSQPALPELRRFTSSLFEVALRLADSSDERVAIVTGFAQRDKPFSSFMLAYARNIGFDV